MPPRLSIRNGRKRRAPASASYRSLGRDIWEVRSSLPHGRIARVLFCVEKDCMVLLHGFMKKTQKTPKQDIDLALKRKKGAGA